MQDPTLLLFQLLRKFLFVSAQFEGSLNLVYMFECNTISLLDVALCGQMFSLWCIIVAISNLRFL